MRLPFIPFQTDFHGHAPVTKQVIANLALKFSNLKPFDESVVFRYLFDCFLNCILDVFFLKKPVISILLQIAFVHFVISFFAVLSIKNKDCNKVPLFPVALSRHQPTA